MKTVVKGPNGIENAVDGSLLASLRRGLAAGTAAAVVLAGASLNVQSAIASRADRTAPSHFVYVGQELKAGPFTVQLQDVDFPNKIGVTNAAIAIYYNGVLTNVASIAPGRSEEFIHNGDILDVKVKSTFEGLHADQKWAQLVVKTAST